MTPETLRFLSTLLDQVTLSAGAPNFAEVAAQVVQARKEIDAALDATSK